jgi:hypothetical protein
LYGFVGYCLVYWYWVPEKAPSISVERGYIVRTSEYITVAEARDLLGVSEPKIARMIRDGVLRTEPNPVDKRSKIIRRSDVLALAAKIPAREGKEAA